MSFTSRFCLVNILFACVVLIRFAPVLTYSHGHLPYCSVSSSYGNARPNPMFWAVSPAVASFYTVRSGDGSGGIPSDPTSYIPNQLNAIHIRTLSLDKVFIGLMLYAVDADGAQTGTWSIAGGYEFHTPSTCNYKAVLHSNANLKPMHSIFYFSAPPGTGTVTFKVLIKQGEQNKGNFYYPSNTLTLTEGTASSNNIVIGKAGESCNYACAKVNKACSASASASLNSVSSLISAVSPLIPCRFPVVAGSQSLSPALDGNKFCYFQSSASSTTVCSASNYNVARACSCTTGAAVWDTPAQAATPTLAPTTMPTGSVPQAADIGIGNSTQTRQVVVYFTGTLPSNLTTQGFGSRLIVEIATALGISVTMVSNMNITVHRTASSVSYPDGCLTMGGSGVSSCVYSTEVNNYIIASFYFIPAAGGTFSLAVAARKAFITQLNYESSTLLSGYLFKTFPVDTSSSLMAYAKSTVKTLTNCGSRYSFDCSAPPTTEDDSNSIIIPVAVGVGGGVFVLLLVGYFVYIKAPNRCSDSTVVPLETPA